MEKNNFSKWHNEIALFSQIKSLLILEGNILDTYQYPISNEILNLNQYLYKFYKSIGYSTIVFYDNIDGFYNDLDDDNIERFAKLTNQNVCLENNEKKIQANFRDNSATNAIKLAYNQNIESCVVIMSLASRYIISPTQIILDDVEAFSGIIKASLNSKEFETPNGRLRNLTLFTVNKVND